MQMGGTNFTIEQYSRRLATIFWVLLQQRHLWGRLKTCRRQGSGIAAGLSRRCSLYLRSCQITSSRLLLHEHTGRKLRQQDVVSASLSTILKTKILRELNNWILQGPHSLWQARCQQRHSHDCEGTPWHQLLIKGLIFAEIKLQMPRT